MVEEEAYLQCAPGATFEKCWFWAVFRPGGPSRGGGAPPAPGAGGTAYVLRPSEIRCEGQAQQPRVLSHIAQLQTCAKERFQLIVSRGHVSR